MENVSLENMKILEQIDVAKAIIDTTQDSIFLVNDQFKIFFANRSACVNLGYTEEELIGKDVGVITANNVYNLKISSIQNAVEEKTKVRIETLHMTKTQKLIPVETVVNKMVHPSCCFYCLISRDITERKAMELALREHERMLMQVNSNLESKVEEETSKRIEKEQLLLAIYDSANVAISVADEDGRFVYVNRSFLDLFGYEEQELIGKSFLMLVREEAKEIVEREYKQFVRERVVDFASEHEIERKDGTKRMVLVSRKVISKADGQVMFVSFFIDVTKQKMLEIEYKKQEELLVEQSRLASMGEMISAIAHQWRQPLNIAGVIVQGLVFDYQNGTLTEDVLKEAVKDTMDQLKHMSSTIDNFRNFAKSGRIKERFNVIGVVKEAVMLVSAQLTSHQIMVRYVEELESFFVDGFAGELKQVILNLLLNARDVLIEKRVEDGEIVVSFLKSGNAIKIAIEDNGGGIDKSIINRVFEPYFTTKDQSTGTGIGLYMSKMIIERSFSGIISVQNGENGASFEIILQGDIGA